MEAATLPRFDPQSAGQPIRAGRRARGLVPGNLRERLEAAGADRSELLYLQWFARDLDGIHPAELTEPELARLRDIWKEEPERVARCLTMLEQVGYGQRALPSPRRFRRHGSRRERRLEGVLGKLPRAIALRMPTSADTDRNGRNDGNDRWGPVRCSMTLRADHLGITAAGFGIWAARARDSEQFVETNACELASLIWPRKRFGGKDNALIHELLADLEGLELSADVEDRSPLGLAPSEAHRIPSSPIARVERRLGDRWLPAAEYAEAVERAGDHELRELHFSEHTAAAEHGAVTIRIHFAPWALRALADAQRRPVYLNFRVWRHLRPTHRRLYAFLQAHQVENGELCFYLARDRYTLGIRDKRAGRAGAIVSDALHALREADQRYRGGYGRTTMSNGQIGFVVKVGKGQRSEPTLRATAGRSEPRRPGVLRGQRPGFYASAAADKEARDDALQVVTALRASERRRAGHHGPQPLGAALARRGLNSGDDADDGRT